MGRFARHPGRARGLPGIADPDRAPGAPVTQPFLEHTLNRMQTARFETNKGSFSVELYPEEAPGTVQNFTKLVQDGFYDGIVFHRVIPDFVVQGGDPLTKELPLTNPR